MLMDEKPEVGTMLFATRYLVTLARTGVAWQLKTCSFLRLTVDVNLTNKTRAACSQAYSTCFNHKKINLPMKQSTTLLRNDLNCLVSSSQSNFNRHYSAEAEKVHAKKEQFNVFYSFPFIVIMRALSRLKIYQTATMAVFLPVMKYMEMTGGLSSDVFWTFTAMTGISCGMLYVMSHYFMRLIGIMSLSESGDTVKVSHLTFWGRRRDLFIPVEEIVPLIDLGDNVYDIYIKFRRYDSAEYLLYTIRYGYVKDMDIFKKVFGEAWHTKQ